MGFTPEYLFREFLQESDLLCIFCSDPKNLVSVETLVLIDNILNIQ